MVLVHDRRKSKYVLPDSASMGPVHRSPWNCLGQIHSVESTPLMIRNQGIQGFEFLLRSIARSGVLRYSQSSGIVLQSVLPSWKQAASRNLEKAGGYAQHRIYDSALVGDGKEGIEYIQYLCTCFQRNVPHGFQPFEDCLWRVVPG